MGRMKISAAAGVRGTRERSHLSGRLTRLRRARVHVHRPRRHTHSLLDGSKQRRAGKHASISSRPEYRLMRARAAGGCARPAGARPKLSGVRTNERESECCVQQIKQERVHLSWLD